MTPNDIIVGALYRHADHPNTVYLGCASFGIRRIPSEKFLVIIKSGKNWCGAKVAFDCNDEESKTFWSKFTAASQTFNPVTPHRTL